MSYLHCHKCSWEQDDFWSWEWQGLLRFWQWSRRPLGYNPLSLILEDIAEYARPRFIKYDSQWAEENGFRSNRIFSWHIMWWEIRIHFVRLFTQKWWTQKGFKKDYDAKKATCPSCGSKKDWDID